MGILNISEQSLLVQAIFSQNAEMVKFLLEQKEEVNELLRKWHCCSSHLFLQDEERRTALHAAACVGDVHIMDLLISSGANVNAKDQEWLTPLHRAAASQKEKAVVLLLRQGAEVNAQDRLWQTPLHVAAANRATECVDVLVSYLSSLNEADRFGRTALHHAAHSGHTETVTLLLHKGANLSAKDIKDRQPIHLAAYLGHLEVVMLLVSCGADVSCRDKDGFTPLHVAAFSGHTELVQYLLRHEAEIDEADVFGNTALHMVCYAGQDTVASELVSCGASVNQTNMRGCTPLHLSAVSTDGLLCFELLINNGTDVNLQNIEGKSPLHMTAMHGRFTCSQILIQNGKRMKMRSAQRSPSDLLECLVENRVISTRPVRWRLYGHSFKSDVTSLCHEVASESSDELHLYTVNIVAGSKSRKHFRGAEVECADKYSYTPLHTAAKHGQELLVSTLMSNGADAARQDINGMCPLHLAVLYGFSDCCHKLLSSAGFDINSPDSQGRTCLHIAASVGSALHYASVNGWYLCTVALVKAGVDVNEVDVNGCSALHYAAATQTSHRAEQNCPDSVSMGDNDEETLWCLEFLLDNAADPALRDSKGFSAVHYAAAHGNKHNLKLLLEMSFRCVEQVESCVPVGPLHLAAYNGHSEALEVLLEMLVNVDVQDSGGRTALYVASLRGHSPCVEVLLVHGASYYMREHSRRWTPLHAAAANGQTDCLLMLLKKAEKTDIINLMDIQGQTPLMLATLGCHIDCVHMLLERGSNPDTGDKRRCTALHRAAVIGSEECVLALLVHGAFVLCRDIHGRSPLHLAASCGHAGLLRRLLEAASVSDPLDSLLDYTGYTPVHWAAYHGHKDCLEVLLEYNTSSIWEGNSFTPLHCALINGHYGAAELMVETMATIINLRDAKGRTPLHAAAYAGNVAALQLALTSSSDVNLVDCTGRTAIMVAAENGHTSAVDVLLHQARTDLSLLDINRNTALHIACRRGHEMCALLILAEIDDPLLINTSNSALQTPLHLAARNGLVTVVEVLLTRGATVLAVDRNGHTPALACAPNKDVADCLALIISTMKTFSAKPSTGSSCGLSLRKHFSIAASHQSNITLQHTAYTTYTEEL
ncbi:serine/threonine-protein phosphatase 6 regulatory ankyrin repeat subunit C-like isoform X2 [Myxocyprinus asiaticus]|uniref:serine/threonine-protein phosphatase 6 regulatory ankyrin repeat subunit C-like isoform X2 n=1 Tax=Myxocyprinus asiaticus TaxID=70543 RepID=UPI0022212FA5|nr:serine/threonine-protein phosphatase 6 regulatory ankyrin repeat subunit C-like isoform X2 [Myxocyprinus asiaticus]